MQVALFRRPLSPSGFATEQDHAYCRRLHRIHGTTYFFSSRRLPLRQRRHVDALYGFVREADEWVDNPGSLTRQDSARLLAEYRTQMRRADAGERPANPALRAFSDMRRDLGMPLDEPEVFLDAMEMDLTRGRYETWDDLCGYMRGSAAAVGVMMCWVIDAPRTPEVLESAMALGNAMQLTNFIRDVGEDTQRGRIYLPLEDLRRFGVDEQQILERRMSPEVAALVGFQIERARGLFAKADTGIEAIPSSCRLGVRLARVLYSKILDKVEERGRDVLTGRARTTGWEKTRAAIHLALAPKTR